MKKLIVPLALILLLALAACGGSTPEAANTPEAAAAVTQVTEASPTAVPATEAPAATPTTATEKEAAGNDDSASPVAPSGPASCRAESIDNLINLPPATIAPVSDADWQEKGNQAKITLVEYGDFQ